MKTLFLILALILTPALLNAEVVSEATKLTIELDNKTHPEVVVLAINVNNNTVDFRYSDGIGNAPLLSAPGTLPTLLQIKLSIDRVLFEKETPVAE